MAKHNHISIILLFSLALFLFLHAPTQELSAQSEELDCQEFYDITQAEKIVERAKKAGFTNEERREMIDLRVGDQKIDVFEYKERLQRCSKQKDQRLKEFLSKRFLTIKDIYNELSTVERKVIKKIREELVSER